MKPYIKVVLAVVAVMFFNQYLLAQPGTEIEIKDKPKRYQNRKLRAEKTQDKRNFHFFRRFTQNNFTHFNYYHNAKVKLDELLAKAKAAHKDDYDSLLSYYNYSLDATAQEKTDIDSIIYKSTAGILLHDLRSDWVDNMYMLMGQAYFYRKDMDSAYNTFQYINYSFAPKEDGGYHIPIGSNAAANEGVFSIATKEKQSIVKKALTVPPSRNESLLWLVRVFIETGEMGEAIGLIQILRNDPSFPKRLKVELDELTGYWYYRQKTYDSAAHYVIASLPIADGATERARKQYLAAQLYVLAGQPAQAVELFNASARHTNDPVMEVNATLNAIKNGSNNNDETEKRIEELLKLARKDKYAQYRDVIYFTAAKAELERKNLRGAESHLLKSVHPDNAKPGQQRASGFFLLADVEYNLQKYTDAARFYDSVEVNLLKETEKKLVDARKPSLAKIAKNINDIKDQDSLQYIASLSEKDKIAYYKKLNAANRKKKREQRQAEQSAASSGTPGAPMMGVADTKGDSKKELFADTKGDWYFNSSNAKSRGFSEFTVRWGKRPNVDNWRREAAIEKSLALDGNVIDVDVKPEQGKEAGKEEGEKGKTATTEVPTTPETLEASNGIIEEALNKNAAIFSDELMDYPAAVDTHLELLRRFPKTKFKDEALFRLSYLAAKVGNQRLADSASNVLANEFSNSKWNNLKLNPEQPLQEEDVATRQYEKVYNMFIEGRFDDALVEKKKADSLYGEKYWTQQLLFIESIYYIKQQQDSLAILKLTGVAQKNPASPLAERATTMIDVLRRRKEIEEYLSKLNVTKEEEEVTKRVDLNTPEVQAAPKKDIAAAPAVKMPEAPKKDSILAAPKADPSAPPKFTFNASDQHYVTLVLDKVDQVFVNESKNAFTRYNGSRMTQPPPVAINKLSDQYNLVLIGPFKDAGAALEYVNSTKPVTAARILPWLNAAKYSYGIISDANLKLLQQNKEVDAYRKMLSEALPGVF